jgi:hypothetical protein
MVSNVRIENDITHLAASPRNSKTNAEEHASAIDWIAAKFEGIGLSVRRQMFDIPQQAPARTGTNIIGEFNSENIDSQRLLIGAHFDTVPDSPGADDNASGVAAILECARVLIEGGSERRITFVAFDAEEMQPPVEGLHGSTAYVESLNADAYPAAAIIFESIGFRSISLKQHLPGSFRFLFRRAYNAIKRQDFEANSLLILSKGSSKQISRQLERSAAKHDIQLPILPLEVPWWMPVVRNLRRSDHAPFWSHDIPAVMISDTANFRNPNYHTPLDTADTIDVELVSKAVRTVIDVIERGAV